MIARDWRKEPRRRSLKLNAWPEPDRRSWEIANRTGDILEPGGKASHWAPSTRETTARCYGRWLAWLTRNGLLDETQSPGNRLTPDRLELYVAELIFLNAHSSAASQIGHLHMAISAMEPKRDWQWMRPAEARLRQAEVPKDKRSRLVEPDQLYAFGIELMDSADAADDKPVFMRAVSYRDGLMISLLAARPFRRRNFVSIEIGRHLVFEAGRYWLRFEAKETKNRQRLEQAFPEPLAPYLERYLAVYRPVLTNEICTTRRKKGLAPSATSALWVSERATPMSIGATYGMIMKRTKARFGRAVHPHLFRHGAATAVATEDPEHVYLTRNLLGHTSLKTSEQYYNLAESLEATRLYQREILALRHRPDESQTETLSPR
jgi:integrase/recombinase XerD